MTKLSTPAENYFEILKNRFLIDRLDNYDLIEVRELAMQKAMWKIEIMERICRVDSNVKQLLPYAKKEGYGEDILSYQLAHDIQYQQAKAVIELIDDKMSITPTLRLSDILLPGLSANDIISRCEGKALHYIGLFLYRINLKGYFKRELSHSELGIIGKDINPKFNWNKIYIKERGTRYPDLDNLPDPKTLIK